MTHLDHQPAQPSGVALQRFDIRNGGQGGGVHRPFSAGIVGAELIMVCGYNPKAWP